MLRFTIRDVLWLTLVVELAVGWWVDRERLTAEPEQLEIQSTMEQQMEFWEKLQQGNSDTRLYRGSDQIPRPVELERLDDGANAAS